MFKVKQSSHYIVYIVTQRFFDRCFYLLFRRVEEILFLECNFFCKKCIIQVERPWDLARDSGQRSWHIPIRITAHPRGAFISVGDWTPTETNLLLLATWRGGSLLDWDNPQSLVNYKEPSLLKIEGFLQPRVCSYAFIISA